MNETSELSIAVRTAMAQFDACAAVRDIYLRLQVQIDQRKPICVASGECCHFESYGHRLYVTTLELAAFLQDLQTINVTRASRPCGEPGKYSHINLMTHYARAGGPWYDANVSSCPLQIDGLCSVHAIRPFGCRIFFCDPTATQWQQERYELFHAELKGLHERFGVPYHYVEWRYALGEIVPNRL